MQVRGWAFPPAWVPFPRPGPGLHRRLLGRPATHFSPSPLSPLGLPWACTVWQSWGWSDVAHSGVCPQSIGAPSQPPCGVGGATWPWDLGSLPRRGPKGSRAVKSPKGKPIDSIRPVKWRETLVCAAFLSPRKEATRGFCDLKVVRTETTHPPTTGTPEPPHGGRYYEGLLLCWDGPAPQRTSSLTAGTSPDDSAMGHIGH